MKLRSKLSLAYGSIFGVVLLIIASMVYLTIKTAMTQTIANHLDNISGLIKRVVEISIDNNWEQVQKNLALADQLIGTGVDLRDNAEQPMVVFSDYSLETEQVMIPEMVFRSPVGDRPIDVVRAISRATEAEVSIYQITDRGLINVASSFGARYPSRAEGHLIPARSPVYDLVLRHGTWIGRDYFSSTWFLTGYRVLEAEEDPVAVLLVSIPQVEMGALREDVLNVEIGEGGFPYIIDSAMNVVIHPEVINERQNWSLEPFAREIAFSKNGHIQYQRGETYVATYKHVPAMNWIVVAASATQDAYRSVAFLSSFLLAIFGLALVASLVTSVLLGRQISKPLVGITQRFKEIAEGEVELNPSLDVVTNDEVGELAMYFNRFVDRVRRYNQVEWRETQLELRDAQINALQAQINPHFLYNTLETIRFMILMEDNRATTIVQYLADLFRISIGKGERFVTIEHEIKHAQLYASIHELRYPDRFRLDIDVSPEIRKWYTLKFIIQPIVENAIHHGLSQSERPGQIRIVAGEEHGILVLTVHDNGVGIDTERLQQIRRYLTDPRFGNAKNIGIKNVHERLRLHFGAEFGLSIDSEIGLGAQVTYRLPALRSIPSDPAIGFSGKPL